MTRQWELLLSPPMVATSAHKHKQQQQQQQQCVPPAHFARAAARGAPPTPMTDTAVLRSH